MKIYAVVLVAALCACFSSYSSSKQENDADKICGIYYVVEEKTKEESKIKIDKSKDGTYYAQVVWMKNPNFQDGTPKRDPNNPNKELRNRRADQMVIMNGLAYDPSKGEWGNGEVYNPINGKVYKCYMEFVTDTRLKVRGYLGITLLGRTMYWTKVE